MRPFTTKSRQSWTLAVLLLMSTIFVVDIYLPLGVAGGVPYVAVILIALNVPSTRFVVAMGAVCSLLTILDVFLSEGPGTTEWWKVIVNRCLALAAIWVTVFLGLQRNRSQETQRRQLEELARFNRLQTVEHLAAALAHELNQPLTAIVLQAEVASLSADNSGSDSLRRSLSEIAEQSHRASAIIRTLRGLIQKAKPDCVRVSVNQLVRAAIRLIEPTARLCRIELRLQLAQQLPDVMGDPIQIEQVLLNLLQNGVDALAQCNRDQRIITVISQQEGLNLIRVMVVDNGSGVSAEQLPRLFEPFVTSKTQGMGLGLSLSRSLIERHGGTLTFESRNGTAFSFTLPTAVTA